MKSNKGLAQDTRPENQQEGTYPFGKNGIQFDFKGTITNEKGFRMLTRVVEQGWQINGLLATDTNRVIIFHTNNVNSRITLFDTVMESTVYQFDDSSTLYKLDFKIENYITGQIQRNHKGELVCAFTDKVTFPKYINFDSPAVGVLKDWNLFPECVYPTLSKTVEPGGLLNVGSYYFATRYYKQDGTKTAFSQVSSGIVITTSDGTTLSDKSIQLQLSLMDLAYDFIEIAVVKKIQGVTSAVTLTKLPVVPGISTITYADDATAETITLEEVLVAPVIYVKAKSIGQLNDALYVGNLEAPKPLVDMQRYANLIKLAWVSELNDVAVNPSEELQNGTKKGFMHGETYAFYIRYKLANGSNSIDFTIPGVPVTAPQEALSTVASVGSLVAPKFKVEDCITVYSAVTKTGLTGPYRNDTETYPNDDNFNSLDLGGLDNRNELVRHHRMPSLKWCKENLYPTETEYGKTKLDLLGVQALNIIIPSEYSDTIVGYEILYAKRTIHNMTQYGEGLSLYGATIDLDSSYYSQGHNIVHTGPVDINPNQDVLRFHAFDILENKPGIKPSYVASQYKLRGVIDTKYLSWSYPSGGSAADCYGNNCHLVDMTTGVVSNSPANFINALANTKYLLNNVNNGSWVNQYMETAFVGNLQGTAMPIIAIADMDSEGNVAGGTTNAFADAYLMTLADVKSNIYDAFYTQQLISAGDPVLLSTPATFFGGDVFLSTYTFHTYGIVDEAWASHFDNGTNISDPEFRGRRFVHRFVCETIANLYTRFEITGNVYSKWYPNNPLPAFGSTVNWDTVYPVPYDGLIDPNQFGYYKGSEGINDFVTPDIFNPYREYLYKFPYRVHRGGKLSRQNTRSWKTFLALDYYECQKNMGYIEHLEGMDDRLLIHHTNALFLTQDKTKLESGLLAVTLGSGDIFQFEPQEAQSSKLGYAGTQHDLACVRTADGYIFADVKVGELYVYKPDKNGTPPIPISNMLSRFMDEYLVIRGNNPFMANGVTLGWDQRYKRLMATVKNFIPVSETAKIFKIDSLDEILAIEGIIGPPNYDYALKTVQGYIVIGDIIFYQGRYMQYLGINGTGYTGTCPPDECECDSPSSLTATLLEDLISTHLAWSGTGPFGWSVSEVTSLGLLPVSSGTTASNFVDLDTATLAADKVYSFSVWAICEGCNSTPTTIIWSSFHVSTETPPDEIVPGVLDPALIHTVEQMLNEAAVFPNTPTNSRWRIKSNNGTWYGYDDDTNCIVGSNPNVDINQPFFGASILLEYSNFAGTWGTNPAYAIQKVALTCKDNLSPVVGPYTINLSPVVATAYTGLNSQGFLAVGYRQWELTVQRAWIGPDATTFYDMTYGWIGPTTELTITIYE
jgi:hypothetical protein